MSFHWTVEVEQAAQVQVVHAFNSIYMTDSTLTLYEAPPSIILSALLALYDEREHPLSATTPIHVLVLVFVHLMSGSTTATLGRNNKNWETLFGALGTAFKARLREWLVESEGGLTRGGATTHHVAAWFREHSQGGSLPADLQLDISAALEWAKELFVVRDLGPPGSRACALTPNGVTTCLPARWTSSASTRHQPQVAREGLALLPAGPPPRVVSDAMNVDDGPDGAYRAAEGRLCRYRS